MNLLTVEPGERDELDELLSPDGTFEAENIARNFEDELRTEHQSDLLELADSTESEAKTPDGQPFTFEQVEKAPVNIRERMAVSRRVRPLSQGLKNRGIVCAVIQFADGRRVILK